jgi:hypothetical protein
MTDRIELAEHRSDDDDLSVPLFIRVAGTKHYAASAQVQPETALQLVREPTNARDQFATMLCARDAGRIGYVPRQYSRLVARALDAGQAVQAVAVRWLAVPAAERRLVVRLSRVPLPGGGS